MSNFYLLKGTNQIIKAIQWNYNNAKEMSRFCPDLYTGYSENPLKNFEHIEEPLYISCYDKNPELINLGDYLIKINGNYQSLNQFAFRELFEPITTDN